MIQFKRGTTKAMSSDDLDKIIKDSIEAALGKGHSFTILDLLFPGLSTIAGAAKLAQEVNKRIKASMEAADGTWEKIILSNGQPGYDRRTHKLKIGDGESTWQELPNVGGLDYDQVLDAENKAKIRLAINPTDKTVFTYGEEDLDKFTVGQVYLQQYDGPPEADYVTEFGISGIWQYRKWRSGFAECWGNIVQEGFSTTFNSVDYPFAFTRISAEAPEVAVETATLTSTATGAYLVTTNINSLTKSGSYLLTLDDDGETSLEDTSTAENSTSSSSSSNSDDAEDTSNTVEDKVHHLSLYVCGQIEQR
jgi:hypothetical protein